MTMSRHFTLILFTIMGYCNLIAQTSERPCYSGIYPHLAAYNSEEECGTGAVVPWANRLWVVTYSPHMPYGSDDKLYEITPTLEQIIRPESQGGTPANRLIHCPTNQLFIGPYVIDSLGNVRALPYSKIPGRPTGTAMHLTDPANRVLLGTMESGFYDIDMHTLEVKELYKDGNQKRVEGFKGDLCTLFPGYHGKGFYSSQGVAVYSNNGEEGELAQRQFDIPSGSLNEWDGKEWKTVRRCQFTEVTGPNGIEGKLGSENDPIWSLGFDYRSVILAVREPDKGWSYYRLPKASYAYDGAHGWNTEWPRIRNVGTEEKPEYLMTMHGMMWHFPQTFGTTNSSGIKPRGAYLKVIADFTRWGNRLVFGCDDSAKSEFLNKRKQKGTLEAPGQSNSNLWFTSLSQPDHLGPTTASGSIWLHESVKKDVPSDPFLIDGWDNRCVWLSNHSNQACTITLEVDKEDNQEWQTLQKVKLSGQESVYLPLAKGNKGVWLRATSDQDIQADLSIVLAQQERRGTRPDKMFEGLNHIGETAEESALLWGLPNNRRALGIASDNGYYELNGDMLMEAKTDPEMEQRIRKNCAIPHDVVEICPSSILIVDAKGRRWRLPLGDKAYSQAMEKGELRICREVATERDLLSLHGTFYELPAENADGFAKVRPICSHPFAINDYASYRGLMVLSGVHAAKNKEHILTSSDGKVHLWAGAIDDLWKMGKPTGQGGPWHHEVVKAQQTSDPYLIANYDQRSMELENEGTVNVSFTVQVDPTGDGQWLDYKTFEVNAGQHIKHRFPKSFQARWIRIKPDKETKATATFTYR